MVAKKPNCAACGRTRDRPLPPYRDMTAWVCDACSTGEAEAVYLKLREAVDRVQEVQAIVDDEWFEGRMDAVNSLLLDTAYTHGKIPEL